MQRTMEKFSVSQKRLHGEVLSSNPKWKLMIHGLIVLGGKPVAVRGSEAHMRGLAEVIVIVPRLQALAKLHKDTAVRTHLDGLMEACVRQPDVAGVEIHRGHVGHVEGLGPNGTSHSTCSSTEL